MINIIFRHRYLLAFFVACLLAVGLAPRALAADLSFTNVNTDWSFTYSKSKDIIIAQKDNRIAVYQTSDIGWEQQPDYYNQGGETFSCGSHIVLTPATTANSNIRGGAAPGSTDTYTLYEGDKGGCANDQYSNHNIAVTEAKDLGAASIKNYGQEPVGCPGFAGTPEPGTNYICPDGKNGVIEGKYKKNGAEKAKKAAEEAAKAALVAKPVDTSSTDGCYEKMPGGIAWLMCGALDAADSIYGFFKGAVFKLLALPELGSNNDLKASWSAVKSIANASLILVALVMIGSQIFNFSFIDAYTVKKVLPRLVIAVILIQLSWFLFTGLIQITNAVGYSLTTLLTYPFKHGDTGISSMMGDLSAGAKQTSALFTGATIGIGAGVGAAALAGGGWISLALVAVGVIISILVAFFTLIIRKLLLFILLVLSPIALVAWILPNTQKLWATWWSLFSKLLIMFPLIAILFAAGQIGASVIITSDKVEENAVSGGINAIIALIAYFAPLFLVPSTFKFAGGIFNTITGALNNVGDKVKKNGFGLRDQLAAQKKYSNEAKAKLRKDRQDESRQKSLTRGGIRGSMGKGRARLAMGPGGFTKRAGKYLEQEKTAGQSRIDAEHLKEANDEFAGATKNMQTFDQQMDYAQAMASRKSFEYTAPDGSKKTLQSSDAMARVAHKALSDGGEVDRVRAAQDALMDQASDGTNMDGKALANQLRNENVGTLLKTAPDLYGKAGDALGTAELAQMKGPSLRNYKAQLKQWETEHDASKDDNKRKELLKRIEAVQQTASTAMKAYSEGTLSITPGNREMLEQIAEGEFDATGKDIGVDFAGRKGEGSRAGETTFVVNKDRKPKV